MSALPAVATCEGLGVVVPLQLLPEPTQEKINQVSIGDVPIQDAEAF